MIKHDLSRFIKIYQELSKVIKNCRKIQLPLVYQPTIEPTFSSIVKSLSW